MKNMLPAQHSPKDSPPRVSTGAPARDIEGQGHIRIQDAAHEKHDRPRFGDGQSNYKCEG